VENLSALYELRFNTAGIEKRRRVWRVLCDSFFSTLIPPDSTVLDIACGYGEFINQIPAKRKYAVDLNEDSAGFLNPDVTFVRTTATDLKDLPAGEMDFVFTSNSLEHLKDKAELSLVLEQVRSVLKPTGKFIVLGPNIRYAFREYWDFYDHHLPLSHLSLVEGLTIAGFRPEKVIDRFLPYTMSNGAPAPDFAIRAYLAFPIAWKILGKQFLVVAQRAM